jgi:hypothetical protein
MTTHDHDHGAGDRRREPTLDELKSAERAWRDRVEAELRVRNEREEAEALRLEQTAEEVLRQECGHKVALFRGQTAEQLRLLLGRLRYPNDLQPDWFERDRLDAYGQLRPDGSRVFASDFPMPDEFLQAHVRELRRAAIRARFKWLRETPIDRRQRTEPPKKRLRLKLKPRRPRLRLRRRE